MIRKLRSKGLVVSTNELHVWRNILTPNIKNKLNDYWHTLALDEKRRADQFHFERDKIRYITARGVLREIIAGYIEKSPEAIEFGYTQYGKPYLITNSSINKLYFNLSHSYNCNVYAFTKNIEIGIDVELYQPEFAIESVASCCFSKQECKKLQNLSTHKKHDYFYKIWTLKEAYVKSTGLGLAYDLQQIKIDLSSTTSIHSMSILNNHEEGMNWTLQSFAPYKNYYAAFAIRQIPKQILYLDFDSVSD